ncbi:MAG: FAD-dependent oxidoreductase [Firmicutes bacterium]|nr:FAD-dependent oxidoreductase [Bacillota bacterium]
MFRILISGGGLAGCTVALELARRGHDVILVEKSKTIGGKVRDYGCKATDICHQCGLCLAGVHGGSFWSQVEAHPKIKIFFESQVLDIFGAPGNYQAILKNKNGVETIAGLTHFVAAIGFEPFSDRSSSSLEYQAAETIITGSRLEKLLKERSKKHLFPMLPSRVGFIQCYGSRDCREQAGYCSRVCCGYSTRAARVLRQYYQDAQITFFYMDLQQVETDDSFASLQNEGIEFVRCRPVKIKPGSPPAIVYEKPETGEIAAYDCDWIILSEGIHPARDTAKTAEIFGLGLTGEGFLKYVKDPRETGIYLAGCAGGPESIAEVYAGSLRIAREIQGGI